VEEEMISVDQRAAIRHAYYHEHKSVRQIARDLKCSRKTVDKALASAHPTPYTRSVPYTAPKLGAFHARIAELLAEQARQPRKQRYTSHKIFEILRTEGYTGSESRIRGYIGQCKRTSKRPPVFVPLEFDPGQDAQVDWGEAIVILAGARLKVQLFVMRLCYSRRTFALLFPTQRQEAFFEGHVRAFHFFAGVPHRISYDNLTTAIRPIFTGRTRQEQQAFTAFRSHYLFQSHFCTPGQGHEKGQVEHGVGYVRRNFLVPLPQADSFAALNEMLLVRCGQDDARQVHGQEATIGALWTAEQPLLRELPPHDIACCITVSACLTPYSQVIFETNRYSVPVERAARQFVIKAYPFHVEIVHQDQIVARHPRCYDRETDVFDPLHYLPLLEQRPGAFEHAKPLRRWRENWPLCYKRLLYRLREQWPEGRGIREFVQILRLHETHPAPLIEQAIEQALTYGCVHAEGVKLCLHHLLRPEHSPDVLDLTGQPHLAQIGAQPLDFQLYDALLTGGA
jgi:transposase